MSDTLIIIDTGSGNLRSAAKAFEKAGAGQVLVSSRADDVKKAQRIVLPGQGAFADCMKGLTSLPGMVAALEEAVLKQGKPFFGICVGMQLLAARGFEHGQHNGLGWLGGEVKALTPSDATLKIPHMGWNNLRFEGSEVRGFEVNAPTNPRTHEPAHPLLKDLGADPYVYFVHSYAFTPAQPEDTLASCDYGGRFTAMVARGNIAGTQFHPEKSQKTGLQLIKNFLEWKPQ
ncbi:MAG TPA: imidazole glycerol phosphate synthase subunit HisH [Alphaproteobacteria bacterium]|nr:imidazole glycerol phosphate synthase subunit HisH [Alphaproteobacteria bacterium]